MLLAVTAPAMVAVAAAAILLGFLFLWLLRRQDERTWVLARAPHLPIRALAAGDDAWLRGEIRSQDPLICPWFDVACVAYSYEIEREETTTKTDSEGNVKTETSWETEYQESRQQDFDLTDDGGESTILVRLAGAKDEASRNLDREYEHSSLRHCASVIEVGATVSVLGVKGDDDSFRGEREVPLLITRREASDRLQSAHRSEAWKAFFSWFLPLAGGCAVAAMWCNRPVYRSGSNVDDAALIAAAGLVMALPFWTLATYNRLVRLRHQVHAGFRQVDVDLAVRSGLVPNLVAVVKASCSHEQGLLERLAQIRNPASAEEATATEPTASRTAHQVLMLHEDYPELRTNTIYRDLHERLWAVEEKLAHSRQLYNDLATEWNNRTQRFPAVLLARLCGYRHAPPFEGADPDVPPPLRKGD